MQLRNGRPLSEPPSPGKHTVTLPGIPEAVPGPNAFAQQAARMERHRVEGNAFYQQEVQKRRATPPTAMHPALRSGTTLAPPSSPKHTQEMIQRDSTVTTMSQFINAGKETSPDLRLVPKSEQFAEPTNRGYIEEHHEQLAHVASGNEEDRTPVYDTYHPTPKPASSEFATPRKPRISLPKKETTATVVPKSPKKSFFERLRMTKIGISSSPSTSTLGSTDGSVVESEVPPKAQALLGATPSKGNLTRSPSKQRKGIFAGRKFSEEIAVSKTGSTIDRTSTASTAGEAPLTASSTTAAKTPQTSKSDPTHYSFHQGKRMPSQTFSDQGSSRPPHVQQCAIQRSQSLKYMDSAPPPTPPAKNTPPDQKAQQQSITGRVGREPAHEPANTPSKGPAGIVSTSDRISPTRFGSYGHREMAKLVTQPSMYSLHASIVPEMCERKDIEERKSRMDGLGLEGFNMPPEHYYHQSPKAEYSPSIYADGWGARASIPARTPRHAHRKTMDDLPTLIETCSERDRSSHATKKSSSSGGTIPVCYPELSSDPSFTDMASLHKILLEVTAAGGSVELTGNDGGAATDLDAILRTCAEVTAAGGKVRFDVNRADAETLPLHGHTHSRDHSNSPTHSMDAGLFAAPISDDKHESQQFSPVSFNHPSALPSPLHFLPSTVYVPTPCGPRRIRDEHSRDGTSAAESSADLRGSGLGITQDERSASASPTRGSNPFDNVPVLQAPASSRSRASPRPSINDLGSDADEDVDPQKPRSIASASTDKQDQMLDILNKLIARNDDIARMRDEMQAATARLDGRLAAMETLNQSFGQSSVATTPTTPYYTHEKLDKHPETPERNSRQRVATTFAHDFYRRQSPSDRSPPRSVAISTEAEDSILKRNAEMLTKLQEENRKLCAMVREQSSALMEMQQRLGETQGR